MIYFPASTAHHDVFADTRTYSSRRSENCASGPRRRSPGAHSQAIIEVCHRSPLRDNGLRHCWNSHWYGEPFSRTISTDRLRAEMYSPVIGQSPLIDSLFLGLRKKVAAEIRFQKELVKTKGALNMILSFATSSVAV